MIRRLRNEAGQAAPLYITAVTGLLFLALIFFAFGEGDVKRNGAQSAADSAALAAAKESRSLLKLDLKAHVMDRAYYIAVFNAPFVGFDGCVNAMSFAAQNDSTARCRGLYDGRWGYHVVAKSNKRMTANLVPGVKGKRAEAEATSAVINRCKFVPNPDLTSTSIGTVFCKSGLVWVVSPKDLATMPDMTQLFDVRLVED
ncbi:pilus assembly protein TadG-related protein [Streptomyces sp. NPDC057682]|uniref:pilus assembly protein TadG-related protein n=1 Tax=Streptomyces sp. NPDC057682 TaxID=3346210 RepID=UPI00369A6BEB